MSRCASQSLISSARVLLAVLLLGRVNAARAQATDTGFVSIGAASISPFAEISMGGFASLVGNLGGTITNNAGEGSAMTALGVALGEIGPSNANPFVTATVPLRIRSNAGYAVTMQATGFTNFLPPDPRNVQLSDIGFGITAPMRSGIGALASGGDVTAAGAVNDPSSGGFENASTGHWTFATTLEAYSAAPTTLVSGPRIVRAVPRSVLGGLYLNATYCIKPQWFSAGGFSATITFTVATP